MANVVPDYTELPRPLEYRRSGVSWESILKLFTVVIGMFVALSVALALFFGHPTGHYYMNSYRQGAACAVYEDVRFGPDRLMYAGDADRAFQIYSSLRAPVVVKRPGLRQAL